MGTDIHVIVEHLPAPDVLPWEVVEPPFIHHPHMRGYYFFELLRRLSTRGLPDDVSDQAQAIADEDAFKEPPGSEKWEERFGESWLGDRGFFHVSLEVLLAFDWDSPLTAPRWKEQPSNRYDLSNLGPMDDGTWADYAADFPIFLSECATCGRPHEVRLIFGFDG